jgi:hypothetical protein
VPFVAQLVLPPTLGGLDVRMAFTLAYLAAAVLLLLDGRRRAGIRHWPDAVVDVLRTTAQGPAAASDSTEELVP